MQRSEFTLDDFMAQMAHVKELGSMGKIMGMIPGMGDMMEQVNMKEGDIERSLRQMRAMYDSMTAEERKCLVGMEYGRRRRIARGAGVEAGEVMKFVKDFEQSREMMRAVGSMGVMGMIGRRRGRARRAMGLVTHRRFERDPSMIEPTGNGGWGYFVLVCGVVLAVAWCLLKWRF